MNLMIDLETLGTRPDSVVLSIGAVFFDENGLGEGWYRTLSIDEQSQNGREVSSHTLKWWIDQSVEAKSVFRETGMDINSAMQEFSCFFKHKHDRSELAREEIKVWGNGASFDISIMENLILQCELQIPWAFYNIRCFRTFKAFNCQGITIPNVGTAHNALDDAEWQALMAVEGLKRLKSGTA